MKLDAFQTQFFVGQVMDSALSLGISSDDVAEIGDMLSKPFGNRCSPPTTIATIEKNGRELQSICIADNCPLDANATCATCSAYPQEALTPVNITAIATSTSASSANTSDATGLPTVTPYISAGGRQMNIGITAWAVLITYIVLCGATMF